MAVASLFDIKNRKISKKYIVVSLFTALYVAVVYGGNSIINVLTGIIPGVMCFAVSPFLEGALGKADGVMLICLGVLIGIKSTCLVCMLALLTGTVISLFLLALKQADDKSVIPFIPCILCGEIMLSGFSFL